MFGFFKMRVFEAADNFFSKIILKHILPMRHEYLQTLFFSLYLERTYV